MNVLRADGEGVGAVQTARGLLLHRVHIVADRIADYRVLAPTDWNFAPDGPLAAGLLDTEADEAAAIAPAHEHSVLDEPWFIPRTLSDSLRVFGNDVPGRPAIHPLSPGGPEWYRYALTDSVTVSTLDGQRVKLLGVEVTPRRIGASLITGRLWLEAQSGSLVRFTFRFVGSALWVDAA